MKLKEYMREETLVISDKEGEIDTRNLKFTKANINKIANEWDAEVKNIDTNIKHATLKDHLGRLLFVDIQLKRRRGKHGYSNI